MCSAESSSSKWLSASNNLIKGTINIFYPYPYPQPVSGALSISPDIASHFHYYLQKSKKDHYRNSQHQTLYLCHQWNQWYPSTKEKWIMINIAYKILLTLWNFFVMALPVLVIFGCLEWRWLMHAVIWASSSHFLSTHDNTHRKNRQDLVSWSD